MPVKIMRSASLHLFLMLSVALLLSGCGIVNKVRLMNANDDLKPRWSTGENGVGQAQPKADFDYAKPYVYALVNGKTKLKMLIDTGSSITMLFDTEKVKSLALVPGYELEIGGNGGSENSRAFQTEIASLALDSVSFSGVNVGYIPISQTQYFLRREQANFDGVIGNDLLRELVWHFDRDQQLVRIYSALPNDAQFQNKLASATRLPFSTFFGKINFPATLFFNDHQLSRKIVLDTGSRYHLNITSGYFNDDNYPKPHIVSAGYGLSGLAKHHRVTIPALQIGDLTLENVNTNIIEDDEDDFWNVGSALLSQFELIVDYPQKQLYFLPRQNQPFKSLFNLTGLELRKLTSGNFVVVFSSPDLPAHKLNYDIGTEINRINGKPAATLRIDDWLQLASQPGEFEFCSIEKGQNNPCKTIQVQHVPGYSIPDSN